MYREEYASNRGYRVTRAGQVMGVRGKALYVNTDRLGRRYITIRFAGKCRSVYVHKLQAFQKFGVSMYKTGIEVRHKDNAYTNNSWQNILIGTKSQNMMDKPEQERVRIAKLAARAQRKLSDIEATQLRIDHQQGSSYPVLMIKYGIAKSTVSYIVNRKTY